MINNIKLLFIVIIFFANIDDIKSNFQKWSGMNEITPSENEWAIMEVVWDCEESMTASEIIHTLKGKLDVSSKTIRVMINRLVAKGILSYTVYHYMAMKSKKECLELKSERFVNNYFGGNASLAVASFLQSANISEEQIKTLHKLIEQLEKEK